jgi:hypothetical protein
MLFAQLSTRFRLTGSRFELWIYPGKTSHFRTLEFHRLCAASFYVVPDLRSDIGTLRIHKHASHEPIRVLVDGSADWLVEISIDTPLDQYAALHTVSIHCLQDCLRREHRILAVSGSDSNYPPGLQTYVALAKVLRTTSSSNPGDAGNHVHVGIDNSGGHAPSEIGQVYFFVRTLLPVRLQESVQRAYYVLPHMFLRKARVPLLQRLENQSVLLH